MQLKVALQARQVYIIMWVAGEFAKNWSDNTERMLYTEWSIQQQYGSRNIEAILSTGHF